MSVTIKIRKPEDKEQPLARLYRKMQERREVCAFRTPDHRVYIAGAGERLPNPLDGTETLLCLCLDEGEMRRVSVMSDVIPLALHIQATEVRR